MALARIERLTFAYPSAEPALREVDLVVEPGEVVALLGASGSGKSTLLRALAGLVPHFHGGRFSGSVSVGRHDTRLVRPADLAGTVATVFQDPEDQVVFGQVDAELAFGLENIGAPPSEIEPRLRAALRGVAAEHLLGRRVAELSGGELQRVCLAAALALDPRLLLLDEPSSQLDPDGADALFAHVRASGCALVVSEQRPARPLAHADRVVFLEGGSVVLDAAREEALAWLAQHRPAWVEQPSAPAPATPGEELLRLNEVSFAYPGGPPVLGGESLALRRGEIVALIGPNGSGKTTLAKVAAGLLEADGGGVVRLGRAAYLSQDPGRYLVAETVLGEATLAADERRGRAALESVGLGPAAERHPRDLSTGERERLAIACVLAVDADVLVLDEPTRGVDPERKRELRGLLLAGRESRATLLVTHDRGFALSVADRVVAMREEAVLV